MRNHTKHVHDPNSTIYPCTFEEDGVKCTRTFKIRTAVQVHIDAFHLGIRKFACEECDGVSYLKLQDLSNHIRTKHKNIKIKCELCPTLVTRKDYYTRHIKLHHKELDDTTRNALLFKIKETKLEKLILCKTWKEINVSYLK